MGDYLNFNLVWALLCLSGLIAAWVINATGLPGNWIMVAIAAVYCWLMPAESPYAFGWMVVFAMAVLAGVGELLEFFTSALRAKKAGGSRKGMWCSVLGSILGSVAGVLIGIPVPVIGSLVAALLFSAAGALLGAYLGEKWHGRENKEAWRVGVASFLGSLLGSIAKLLIGLVALLVASLAMII